MEQKCPRAVECSRSSSPRRLRIFADRLLLQQRNLKSEDLTLEVNKSSESNALTASAIKSESTGGTAKPEVEYVRKATKCSCMISDAQSATVLAVGLGHELKNMNLSVCKEPHDVQMGSMLSQCAAQTCASPDRANVYGWPYRRPAWLGEMLALDVRSIAPFRVLDGNMSLWDVCHDYLPDAQWFLHDSGYSVSIVPMRGGRGLDVEIVFGEICCQCEVT